MFILFSKFTIDPDHYNPFKWCHHTIPVLDGLQLALMTDMMDGGVGGCLLVYISSFIVKAPSNDVYISIGTATIPTIGRIRIRPKLM